MTINYQFGDVDAHGALIRGQAATLQASIRPSFAMCLPPETSGAGRARRPAKSSSHNWAATSR